MKGRDIQGVQRNREMCEFGVMHHLLCNSVAHELCTAASFYREIRKATFGWSFIT